MNQFVSYITIDAEVRFGKPCIKGTRITVADILLWMASGMSNAEIVEDFPLLREVHLKAALAFAANKE